MTTTLILDKKGEMRDITDLDRYNRIRTDLLVEMMKAHTPCDGHIIVANIDTLDNSFVEGKYYYDEKGKIAFEECALKIMIKERLKDKKKTFTQQEKLNLLIEYITSFKTVPDDDVVYKGCPIGAFAASVDKWEDVCNIVKETKAKL